MAGPRNPVKPDKSIGLRVYWKVGRGRRGSLRRPNLRGRPKIRILF